MNLPIHISICQPVGYVHSMGLIDMARYARYQLRQLGAQVTIGKNRLREDSINIVMGAHLGFDSALKQRYCCIIWNLEQLGHGGAPVSQHYLDLLSTSAVIDYDSRNLSAYGCEPEHVPLVSFWHAPYLSKSEIKLEDRPIDLLFIGGVNERRSKIIQKIESIGINVSRFDAPLYAEERDEFIKQSKAVFNCHFYETSRFEQARAFHVLSLGTPIISERTSQTLIPDQFLSSVEWIEDGRYEDFFLSVFKTSNWYDRARMQLLHFSEQNQSHEWLKVLTYCKGVWDLVKSVDDFHSRVWSPTHINLGSGKDYKQGWLNIDILERTAPDVVLDLSQPIEWPLALRTSGGGEAVLGEGQVEHIYANNVLEHVPNLVNMMTNSLKILKIDGVFEIEVPYEKSMTAWQDPTHIRAMNENSWIYYTEWFWYCGWFEYRFEIIKFNWLDMSLQPCDQSNASFMKVWLRKVESTMQERNLARAFSANYEQIPLD